MTTERVLVWLYTNLPNYKEHDISYRVFSERSGIEISLKEFNRLKKQVRRHYGIDGRPQYGYLYLYTQDWSNQPLGKPDAEIGMLVRSKYFEFSHCIVAFLLRMDQQGVRELFAKEQLVELVRRSIDKRLGQGKWSEEQLFRVARAILQRGYHKELYNEPGTKSYKVCHTVEEAAAEAMKSDYRSGGHRKSSKKKAINALYVTCKPNRTQKGWISTLQQSIAEMEAAEAPFVRAKIALREELQAALGKGATAYNPYGTVDAEADPETARKNQWVKDVVHNAWQATQKVLERFLANREPIVPSQGDH